MKELEELRAGIHSLNSSNKEILKRLEQIQSPEPKVVWHDITGVCSMLMCSTRTFLKYRQEGLIPYTQIGSKVYVRESDILSFLDKHNTNPIA